ncbi:hypothetical protein AV530_004638 [Patagioenas fasciata monilis]|uniref:Uncharacterized protein n=1 Tax=Patagioenas fasciata monilis TaxID=372326 RepID=A0A1V4KHP3_PATFA|nr:hypothetical protein AV530_004638 [Patagioenas fasciata monilis]
MLLKAAFRCSANSLSRAPRSPLCPSLGSSRASPAPAPASRAPARERVMLWHHPAAPRLLQPPPGLAGHLPPCPWYPGCIPLPDPEEDAEDALGDAELQLGRKEDEGWAGPERLHKVELGKDCGETEKILLWKRSSLEPPSAVSCLQHHDAQLVEVAGENGAAALTRRAKSRLDEGTSVQLLSTSRG